MARWAGWGAGPSGAGAAGGPSRLFLVISLFASLGVGFILVHEGRIASAGVAAVAALYFAFRLFWGLGEEK